MARTKYNHKNVIKSFQPSPNKAIYPGMVIEFGYIGDNIFDKRPMVLVLWNNYYDDKIEGINLNYLAKDKIKVLFTKLVEGSKTYSKKQKNPFTVEDQTDEKGYDDNLPYRNLLKKPYTRMKLPTYRETKGGNPLGQAQAKLQMNMLYERVIKRFLYRGKDYQVYRSYKYKKMKSIKVLEVDLNKF